MALYNTIQNKNLKVVVCVWTFKNLKGIMHAIEILEGNYFTETED